MIDIEIYKKGKRLKGIERMQYSVNPDGILLRFNKDHGVYGPVLDDDYRYELIISK